MTKLEEYLNNERIKLELTPQFIAEKRLKEESETFKTNYFILKKQIIEPVLKKSFEDINYSGFAKAELIAIAANQNYKDEFTDTITIKNHSKYIQFDIVGQCYYNSINFRFTSDIHKGKFRRSEFDEEFSDLSMITPEVIDMKIIKMIELLK